MSRLIDVSGLPRLLVAAALAGALVACGSTAPGAAGTVSGVVLSAPSCPVERAGSPCPPRPVPGAEVTATRGASRVAQARSDDTGRFTLRLDPGTYTVTARQIGGIGSAASTTVTVTSGGDIAVTLTIDSGIR